jgi:hypothetical protein
VTTIICFAGRAHGVKPDIRTASAILSGSYPA